MIYFTAEYEDAKELLSLGAAFDFSRWQWRVENYADYAKFSKFLGGNIITRAPIRILRAGFKCPYCGRRSQAFAVCTGAYTQDFGSTLYGAGEVNILYGFEKVKGELREILKGEFGLKKRYSEPDGYDYLLNGCNGCGKPFPNEYLFGETDSPFFIDAPEKCEKLKVYVWNHEGDVCLGGMIKWSFPQAVLAKCGEIQIKR